MMSQNRGILRKNIPRGYELLSIAAAMLLKSVKGRTSLARFLCSF